LTGDGPAVRLAESVTVLEQTDGIRLIRGARMFRVRGPRATLAHAAHRLTTGVTPGELDQEPHGSALRQLARNLGHIGWLAEHDPAFGRGSSVERQIGYLTLFGNDAAHMQQQLCIARAAVLGVGAVGAVLAQHLVGAGVRELWLIDHDRVALHNLNRQFLAGRHDVGSAKTQVVAKALLRQAPAARLHQLDRMVAGPADLDALPGSIDLLLVAADTPPEIGHIVWEWAKPRDVAICFAAVGLGTGYWGPLLVPSRGHCWTCFERARKAKLSADERAAESTSAAPSPYSFGPANTTVSALCAHETIRYLATGDCALMNGRWHIRFADNSTSYLPGPSTCDCVSEASHD
jgi:hypothetical protein